MVIKKNAKIPCSTTEPFFTMYDNQLAANLRITQSPIEETDPRFVRIIWNGKLDFPPNRPKGMEIKVSYSYQENGVMKAEFVDSESGKKVEVDITAQSEGAETTINIDDFIVN